MLSRAKFVFFPVQKLFYLICKSLCWFFCAKENKDLLSRIQDSKNIKLAKDKGKFRTSRSSPRPKCRAPAWPYLTGPRYPQQAYPVQTGQEDYVPLMPVTRSINSSFPNPKKLLSALASLFKITSTWLPVSFRTRQVNASVCHTGTSRYIRTCPVRN